MSVLQEMSMQDVYDIYLTRLAHTREQRAIGLKLGQTIEAIVSERKEKEAAQQREAIALQKKELAMQEKDAALAEIERLKALLDQRGISY